MPSPTENKIGEPGQNEVISARDALRAARVPARRQDQARQERASYFD
jgi:hypothetical protein